jgi:hypothetical protein
MSGIIEFFNYAFVKELEGIDTGEKCLGDQKNPWAVGCAYGVTLGKSGAGFLEAAKTGDWRRDPCVVYCGIWKRVKRLIGKFRLRGKSDYNIPTCIVAVRGTAFTVNIADDGTTLVAVGEGEVEVIDKTDLHSIIVKERQQITAIPQKPVAEPCVANKDLLAELIEWKKNIINEEDVEELEVPENTVIELSRGRFNYASLGSEKGG